ncbi:MAG TPA: cyclic nucleotide-binding domain-containing protein, partial [Vicinamibacteria bacterium]|nr:cyclic nucleotide-binding domain-containing protein [Vicinamibacteria bacterium]
MAISFGKAKGEDVVSLIAAKKYARAIEILKTQLQKKGANPTLRMQLADVLILADKRQEAVGLLLPLADQYARDGFAAKAVSVLKKIQKVDPGRRDVEERLARQIQERQREAVVPRSEMIGLEEVSAPSAEAPADDGGPSLEIGFEMVSVSAPVAAVPLPPPPAPAPVEPPVAPEAAGEAEIEDYDLLYAGEAGEADEEVEVLEAVEAPAAVPMSAGQFADELMGLVDSVFQEFPAGVPAADAPAAPSGPPRGGSQIVVSPLFRDFAVDEMVAVIQGLKLLTFERGGVILREGSAGASLYMLTSGRVRAFKRDPATGKQSQLGDLAEGAFFGEGSILTGQPRMASVVALTHCELLELDRLTLDEITKTHPHVWQV